MVKQKKLQSKLWLNFVNKSNSKSNIIYKSHEEVFAPFEDPTRRTPGIDKIVEFTGIRPTKNIEFMVEKIIDFKQNL